MGSNLLGGGGKTKTSDVGVSGLGNLFLFRFTHGLQAHATPGMVRAGDFLQVGVGQLAMNTIDEGT